MSNVSVTRIHEILKGATRTSPWIEAAILNVTPDLATIPSTSRIPARGTTRRLQALAVMGYGPVYLSAQIGIDARRLRRLRNGDVTRITAAAARKVAHVYERLAMRPGPSAIAADNARRHGWLPPLAWDDIDEPDGQLALETPQHSFDEVLIQRAMAGRATITGPERHEAIRRMTARKDSAANIAATLKISDRTVERVRKAS